MIVRIEMVDEADSVSVPAWAEARCTEPANSASNRRIPVAAHVRSETARLFGRIFVRDLKLTPEENKYVG